MADQTCCGGCRRGAGCQGGSCAVGPAGAANLASEGKRISRALSIDCAQWARLMTDRAKESALRRQLSETWVAHGVSNLSVAIAALDAYCRQQGIPLATEVAKTTRAAGAFGSSEYVQHHFPERQVFGKFGASGAAFGASEYVRPPFPPVQRRITGPGAAGAAFGANKYKRGPQPFQHSLFGSGAVPGAERTRFGLSGAVSTEMFPGGISALNWNRMGLPQRVEYLRSHARGRDEVARAVRIGAANGYHEVVPVAQTVLLSLSSQMVHRPAAGVAPAGETAPAPVAASGPSIKPWQLALLTLASVGGVIAYRKYEEKQAEHGPYGGAAD